MSKQTAVQILVESMTTSDVSFYSKEIAIALQMEREQIESTFRDAQVFAIMEYPISDIQYYEQRYGGEK
jgi:hypothetical protein